MNQVVADKKIEVKSLDEVQVGDFLEARGWNDEGLVKGIVTDKKEDYIDYFTFSSFGEGENRLVRFDDPEKGPWHLVSRESTIDWFQHVKGVLEFELNQTQGTPKAAITMDRKEGIEEVVSTLGKENNPLDAHEQYFIRHMRCKNFIVLGQYGTRPGFTDAFDPNEVYMGVTTNISLFVNVFPFMLYQVKPEGVGEIKREINRPYFPKTKLKLIGYQSAPVSETAFNANVPEELLARMNVSVE